LLQSPIGSHALLAERRTAEGTDKKEKRTHIQNVGPGKPHMERVSCLLADHDDERDRPALYESNYIPQGPVRCELRRYGHLRNLLSYACIQTTSTALARPFLGNALLVIYLPI
jgi:hypothetical protein